VNAASAELVNTKSKVVVEVAGVMVPISAESAVELGRFPSRGRGIFS